MPHRCVPGGCSNTHKDGVSLHLWLEDPRFARLWTNAVKNTRSDFSNPSSSRRLCSAHFTEDCFEAQSIIAKRLGLEMKTIMKADAVPTIFRSGPLLNKRQRQEEDEYAATESRKAQDKNKLPRGAFRKREGARVGL